MDLRVIDLSPASESQQQRTLDEVKDFATTDMDRGGLERWTYRILQEPELAEELKRLAGPRKVGGVDAVSLQPCKTWHYRSQDRYRVEEWSLPDGTWTYAAVFDGHMNHDTVDHISAALGPYVRDALAGVLRSRPSSTALPALVSDVLKRALVYLDDALVSDFLALFPSRDPAALRKLEPARVKQILSSAPGAASPKSGHHTTARAFGGTTALVSLVDPARSQLWVANVGDCVAVLGERDAAPAQATTSTAASTAAAGTPPRWRATVLNSIHNGSNPGELERIRAEHPGEAGCTWNDRVLGFLAPTRALGDAWLKLPAVYAELVFRHLDADWLSAEVMEPHVPRIRTPPYLSSTPDVYHVPLRDERASEAEAGAGRGGAAPNPPERVLILCSDGLSDLYDGYSHQEMAAEWVQAVGQELDAPARPGSGRPHLALALLREAIGGSDTQLVSRNLTVEMEERWMDDTTIVIQRLP